MRCLVIALTFLVMASAHAATISVVPLEHNAEQALVLIEGELVLNDVDVFRDRIAAVRKAVVAFDSNGGSLIAGIEIGKMIRLKNFATLVTQGARCASACSIAWLGGTQRLMAPQAQIGFHAAYKVQLGAATETGVGNAVLGAYLNEIGMPLRAVVYVTETPPDSMTWLTVKEAERQGIDVTPFNPAQLPANGTTSKPSAMTGVTELQRKTGKFLSDLFAKLSGPKPWHCQLVKGCTAPRPPKAIASKAQPRT